MSSFSERFIKGFKSLLPSPLTIALLLTLLTFVIALIFTIKPNESTGKYALQLLEYWEKGLWGFDLKDGEWVRGWQLPFIVQMMLMLVLGYILALSSTVDRAISVIVKYCDTTAKAAFLVTLLTLLVSLFNWGLGLIFGAIFARKVGDFASKKGFNLNYGLIGAAGYSGLMVWHGGLSGSAPIKAADTEGVAKLVSNTSNFPSNVGMDETVFSSMNIVVSIVLLIILPLNMYLLGKKYDGSKIKLKKTVKEKKHEKGIGAERIDASRIFTLFIGAVILTYAFYKAILKPDELSLKFLNPDFINLTLLGLCFLFHKNIIQFLKALDQSIGSSSGILIQFPFYFGILGLMKYSGLMNDMSGFFVEISNESTFPLYTFMSAGIVNIFVPSGGGQWAVQGPIVLEAAQQLGVSLPKSIMAIAYGDQLTNMLQPFWALPLLGITGLKAKEILPYTLFLMGIGLVIFSLALIVF